MEMRKKIVVGFLALTLVAGSMMPMSVSAEEIENTETAAEPLENEEEDFETQMPEMEEPETVLANGASIVESGSCGDNATYTLDSNGELRISGSGEISQSAFENNQNIRKVVISNGITSIGDSAFYNCSNLKSISLPFSVISIEAYAFSYCSNLKYISLPANVKTIGGYAFGYCSSLKNITIPSGIKYIEDSVFEQCTSMEYMIFPKTQINIRKNKSQYFYSLKKIYGYSDTIVIEDGTKKSLNNWAGKKFVSVDKGICFTLDANGGSVSGSTKRFYPAYTYGTLPTPIRSGYTFTGWYTKTFGGQRINSNDMVQSITKQTIYAHWRQGEQKYTVTFKPNGGSVQNGTQTVTSGGSLKSYPTPTRKGYAFDGWYTSASGGKKVTGSVKVTANMTLYAHWVSRNITAPKMSIKVTSYNSVEVSWKRVKGVKGYIIYYSDQKNGKYKQVRKTTKTKVHFSNLKQGKTYYYKVKAYRTAAGQPVYGKYSKVVKRQIKGKPATPKQKIIQVNQMKGTLTISWNKVKNAQKVQILMSTDGGKYKVWRTVSASKGKAEYVYRDKLKKSHIYSFRLRAYYTVDKKNIYSGMSNGWRVQVK